MKTTLTKLGLGFSTVLLMFSAGQVSFAQQVDPAVQAMMERSFREQGIAKLDRIKQDDFQILCSDEKFRASATWSDTLKTVNGGGCYNCHQITKEEISYGTIGPSLLNYGKMRGNSEPILVYTWNRISNSKAYNACSNMPRMAHFDLLTEQQMKDVMALLLDPASPVNK
jgi:sulfur-oxidizing protein SoxX